LSADRNFSGPKWAICGVFESDLPSNPDLNNSGAGPSSDMQTALGSRKIYEKNQKKKIGKKDRKRPKMPFVGAVYVTTLVVF
jgi:hypothetical protein